MTGAPAAGACGSKFWRRYTVTGVAGQTRYRELARPLPTLYLPAAQFQMSATMIVLRTTASLELVTSLARAHVQAVDPDVQVMRVAPFTDMLARPLSRPRFNALLLGVFGIVALLLSTVGLYAVMAAHVRQRDREIAIRLALGATAMRTSSSASSRRRGSSTFRRIRKPSRFSSTRARTSSSFPEPM